ERDGLTSWPEGLPDGELPARVDVTGAAGLVVHGYPALVEVADGGRPADGGKRADSGERPDGEKSGSSAPRGGTGAAPGQASRGPVAVRVLGDPDSAANAHRRGLRRLLVADVGLASQRITTRWNPTQDRKSTRLNSSHVKISYAVFCLKKKTQ